MTSVERVLIDKGVKLVYSGVRPHYINIVFAAYSIVVCFVYKIESTRYYQLQI